MTEHLKFTEVPKPKLKTRYFEVHDIRGVRLGTIKCYARWRRYVFFPEDYTLYDSSCLKTIENFLDDLMAKHKRKKLT